MSPTIVAVAGQKGGTGKSTIACCIAAEWTARGRRVLLVDADPQGTALTWGEVAAEAGHAAPTVIAMGDNVRRDLPSVAAAYDLAVVDCPGRADSPRARGPLLVADLVIIPCGPSAPDVWALAGTLETVRQAQEMRPELRAAVVLNRADRTAMTRSAREALEATGVPVLPASLGSRVAFPEALAAGRGVTSYAGGTVAANELRRVVDELEGMIEGERASESVKGGRRGRVA